MSRYQHVVKIPVNDELQKITGFAKDSIVELHCDFEYWDKTDTKGFVFHSVEFYGMNPNGSEISVCSDTLHAMIQQACIGELKNREDAAYKEYLKSCG